MTRNIIVICWRYEEMFHEQYYRHHKCNTNVSCITTLQHRRIADYFVLLIVGIFLLCYCVFYFGGLLMFN